MKTLQILFIVGLTLLVVGCDPPEAFQPLSPEVWKELTKTSQSENADDDASEEK